MPRLYNSPLDSVTCRNGPAASTAQHSLDNEMNFPGRIHTLWHMAYIYHPEETLWEWGTERRE